MERELRKVRLWSAMSGSVLTLQSATGSPRGRGGDEEEEDMCVKAPPDRDTLDETPVCEASLALGN